MHVTIDPNETKSHAAMGGTVGEITMSIAGEF